MPEFFGAVACLIIAGTLLRLRTGHWARQILVINAATLMVALGVDMLIWQLRPDWLEIYHTVLSVILYLMALALWLCTPHIQGILSESQLLRLAWERSLDGLMVWERTGNDLRLLRQNPSAVNMTNHTFRRGDSLLQSAPEHGKVNQSIGMPLIQHYLLALEKRENQSAEFFYSSARVQGWWKTESIPMSDRLLLLVFRNITEEKELRQTLEYASTHDPLTGCGNKRILERLEQVEGCLYVDLDWFKEINEVRGHAVGDAVLVTIAERLKAIAPIVIRDGGDEFVLAWPSISREALGRAAYAALTAIEEPIDIGGDLCQVTASIGVSHRG